MAHETTGLDMVARPNVERQRAAPRLREQYPWNVRLLAFVVLGGMLWYYWHIEPMMRGSFIIGTPLTLWAGVRIGSVISPKTSRWSDDPHATSQRVLAQPNARPYLYLAAGLVGFLLLTTSSVYLEFDQSGGKGNYEIEVYRGQNLILPPQQVASYSPIHGKVFFFNLTSLFQPLKLRMEVRQPPYRYDSKSLTMRWPWSYRVQVPAGFETKHYRVFRLLPEGDDWMTLNVRKDDPTDSFFRLVVLLKRESDEQKLLDALYFFEPIYFGGPTEMIEFFQKTELESPNHRWNVVGHLKKKFAADKGTFETKSDLLMQNQTVRETIEIDEGATLIVRVFKKNLATKDWDQYRQFEHVVGPGVGIQNILIPN